jgi:type I restriction enzyme R subunit
MKEQYEKELNNLIKTENLKEQETLKYMKDSFRNGFIEEKGVSLANLLPPTINRFLNEYKEKKERVKQGIINFFEKFYDIIQK